MYLNFGSLHGGKLNPSFVLIQIILLGHFFTISNLAFAAAKAEIKPFESSRPLAYKENARRLEQQVTEQVADATLSGQIMIQDKLRMTNWLVYLYSKSMGPPPSKDKYWRVPDLISPVDIEGKFSIDIPDGTYYLTAAYKNPEDEMGPPKAKELHYFHGDATWNPLPIVVKSGVRLNMGVLVPFLWTPNTIQRDKDVTSIEGVVADLEGKPLEGALVFGYLSTAITGRPVFISEKTDKNGKYQLRVHDGGTFYLKVRSVYGGGAPEAGESLNITDEFKPVAVTLRKHQKLQGIALQVKKFPKRGRKGANN